MHAARLCNIHIWIIPHHGILSLLQCISQSLVLRIREVRRFQPCFVTYPWVGVSIDKEIGDGRGEFPLGGWNGVTERTALWRGCLAQGRRQGPLPSLLDRGGKWM